MAAAVSSTTLLTDRRIAGLSATSTFLSKAAGGACASVLTIAATPYPAVAVTPFLRLDAASWGRVLAEGRGAVGFLTVAHPDLLDGTQVRRVTHLG